MGRRSEELFLPPNSVNQGLSAADLCAITTSIGHFQAVLGPATPNTARKTPLNRVDHPGPTRPYFNHEHLLLHAADATNNFLIGESIIPLSFGTTTRTVAAKINLGERALSSLQTP